MRQTWGRYFWGILAFAILISPLIQVTSADALVYDRKLTLMASPTGALDGGSKPGGVDVEHEFRFNLSTGGNVGSIRFEYCTTTEGACTIPTDLNTSSATLASEAGSAITGFTVNNGTAGKPYVTRTAAAASDDDLAVLRLGEITNPSTVGTFFVRINVYTDAALGGTVLDSGVVAASTADQIILTGTMPESLIFCAGGTVSANCGSTTSGSISFNQLFSPTDTAVANSQMAASTNAAQGYVITVNGPTLTSGSATIPGYSSATLLDATDRGISGWGMNLTANTANVAAGFPGSSAVITQGSNGTDRKGQALTDYGTTDTFKFVSGDIVANSAYDGASNNTLGPTNSQVYTASYAANVAGNQLAGTYVSTLTYICTPTF